LRFGASPFKTCSLTSCMCHQYITACAKSIQSFMGIHSGISRACPSSANSQLIVSVMLDICHELRQATSAVFTLSCTIMYHHANETLSTRQRCNLGTSSVMFACSCSYGAALYARSFWAVMLSWILFGAHYRRNKLAYFTSMWVLRADVRTHKMHFCYVFVCSLLRLREKQRQRAKCRIININRKFPMYYAYIHRHIVMYPISDVPVRT
jgi:hypothetical protein